MPREKVRAELKTRTGVTISGVTPKYNVLRSTNGIGGPFLTIGTAPNAGTAPTFTDANLQPGTPYSYEVQLWLNEPRSRPW